MQDVCVCPLHSSETSTPTTQILRPSRSHLPLHADLAKEMLWSDVVCTNGIIERYQLRRTVSYKRVWATALCLLGLLGESADEFHDLTLVVANHCSHVSSLLSCKQRFNVEHWNQHTSSGVHPVDRHWSLEQALVRLELLERVASTGSICDHTASLGRAKVFEDAGQLIGGRSGFLDVCGCTCKPEIHEYNPCLLSKSTYQG